MATPVPTPSDFSQYYLHTSKTIPKNFQLDKTEICNKKQ
jgi:hypothetical protein